jgi:predicted ATPase/DNA-binding SARP family transcriptional activator
MLVLLGASPGWRDGTAVHGLPNTLPAWTIGFLALRGDWVSREHLLTLLWPDAAAAEAQHNLRVNLHRARALLADWGQGEALQAERRRVRLLLPTDVSALRCAIGEHGAAPPACPQALLASMSFAGFPALQEWAELERAALAAAWRDALLARLDGDKVSPLDAVALSQQLLDADPLDESAMLRLLQGLRALGRESDAIRQYEGFHERTQRELGTEPSAALRLMAGTAGAAMAEAGADPRAFIGRRLELAELAQRLGQPATRLLTVVGPGGMGKSCLARQVLPQLPRPALWIDLQDLGDATAAASRIALRLGVELRDRVDAAAQIARALGAERRLIALDNAEHLPDLPDFISHLLDAAPTLVLLVTSRQRLGLPMETLLTLDGLALPDEDSRDAEAATAFDAVRLFDLRARAVQRGFDSKRHIDAVIRIVEAVGGLPLAIELAASWVRLLPPEEIARDLQRTINLLERDPTTAAAPARPEHVSVHAVLERSWGLLNARESDAMASLSVFRGGFTPAAARDVAGVALALLSALVDKSLLTVDASGRFGMHPLVSVEATERARHDPVRLEEGQCRHANHHAAWLARVADEATREPKQVVEALRAEWANSQQAWRHASSRGQHELVARMHPAWRVYFVATGRFQQSVQHFESALQPRPADLADARLRATLAYFLVRDRNPERAMALAGESLAVAEAHGDTELAQECVATTGGCKLILGQWDKAYAWIERSLGLARQRGARRETASELANLGLITTFLGRFDEAIGLFEEAIAIQRELDSNVNAARAMCNLGFVHVARGDDASARTALEAALRFAIDRGADAVALEAQFLLGTALLELGALDDAQRQLHQAREGFRGTRNAGFELKADYYLARIAGRRGAVGDAAHTLLRAVRTARERGWSYDVLYAALFVAELLRAHGFIAEAVQILISIRAAPRAHAYVGTLVARGLQGLPLPSLPASDFDAVADALVCSDGLDALVAGLRAMH